jgi:hypothetical protein
MAFADARKPLFGLARIICARMFERRFDVGGAGGRSATGGTAGGAGNTARAGGKATGGAGGTGGKRPVVRAEKRPVVLRDRVALREPVALRELAALREPVARALAAKTTRRRGDLPGSAKLEHDIRADP